VSRTRSLWRHRDFMRLWSAETISQLGTQVTMLALPLTAILVLHASPFEVGALSSIEFAPFLLIGLPAGVWVDRTRRRPILIAGDLGRALALGSIPLAAAFHVLTLPHLYVAAFVTGICTVFFDVAYQSFLPSLVARDQLIEGNAKLEISRSGAQLAGPGLAGVLVDAVTAPIAILADAISYLGSAAFVLSIRDREEHFAAPEEDERTTMRAEMMDGLRYVVRHPLLRSIAACTSISNLFSSMNAGILVLFAVRTLGLSPAAIGLALAVGNVGFLAGAVAADRIAGRLGLGRTIIAAIAIGEVGAFLVPLATPSTAFAALAVGGGLFGLGAVVYNVNQVGLRQAITPDRMLGRMNATMRFIVWGTLPIGALIGGALGGTIGLRATLWVAAIGGLLAIVPLMARPVRRLVRIPDGDGEDRRIDGDGGRVETLAGGPPTGRPESEDSLGGSLDAVSGASDDAAGRDGGSRQSGS
jgi:MFS family permease